MQDAAGDFVGKMSLGGGEEENPGFSRDSSKDTVGGEKSVTWSAPMLEDRPCRHPLKIGCSPGSPPGSLERSSSRTQQCTGDHRPIRAKIRMAAAVVLKPCYHPQSSIHWSAWCLEFLISHQSDPWFSLELRRREEGKECPTGWSSGAE